MRKWNPGITEGVWRMKWHQVKTVTHVSLQGGAVICRCLLSPGSAENIRRIKQGMTQSLRHLLPGASQWQPHDLRVCSKQTYITSPFASGFFINSWVLLNLFPSCHYFAHFLSWADLTLLSDKSSFCARILLFLWGPIWRQQAKYLHCPGCLRGFDEQIHSLIHEFLPFLNHSSTCPISKYWLSI